jgi:hypothetical protein
VAFLDIFVLVRCWPQGDKMKENLAPEQVSETLHFAENRNRFPHFDSTEAASDSNEIINYG